MNTVATVKPSSPIDIVRAQLHLPSMREQLKTALPAHVTVEKFLRVAMTAIQQNPGLLKMDRTSLFASVVTAAQLGLLPDVQLGECYLVPFKGKVQCIPGYRGLLKLARQGDIGFVEAELIHSNDRTTYVLGDDSRFESIVNWRDRGEPVAVYAVAKFRDGGICARVVMTIEEVNQIRARSQNANGPAWSDNFGEMAKKSALRRISKLLPLSTIASAAFRMSELQEELGKPGRIIDGEVETEAEDQPATLPAAPEAKQKRRKSALDAIVPASAPPSDDRTADAAGAPADDFSVDPDSGELDFGDDDGSAPAANS